MTVGQLRRVVLGVSGGVDSAVAAYLLLKKGFQVIGVFMRNWDTQDESSTCPNLESDLEDATSVCRHLNIELVQVSFVKEYWNDVFSDLLRDYQIGLTPNPDVLCNRFVKFGAFYRHAFDNLDAYAIATGHYARTTFGSFLEYYRPNHNVEMKRATDPTKDQTLFLSQISQEALRKTMFPVGELFKHQVRRIAREAGMESISKKKDSTGICFIGDRKFTDFINEYVPEKVGPFIDIDTNKHVGFHKGVHHWTIGQGCNISGLSEKHYVIKRDPATQTIFIGKGNHPLLFSNTLTTGQPHWISHPAPLKCDKPFNCMFRFQQSQWTIPCELWPSLDGGLQVRLSIPTRAISPGQYAVFYNDATCLGSAKIESKTLSTNKINTPQLDRRKMCH